MISLAKRIEMLRTSHNMTRPGLSAALGMPKNAIEKFETGRQTPTKEQQTKIAEYFGVSMLYLQGETDDPTTQSSWMDAVERGTDPDTVTRPKVQSRPSPKPAAQSSAAVQPTMAASFSNSKAFQDMLRGIVLDVLRSPEGQELLAQSVKKELMKQK